MTAPAIYPYLSVVSHLSTHTLVGCDRALSSMILKTENLATDEHGWKTD
jgi:hypothetical protein